VTPPAPSPAAGRPPRRGRALLSYLSEPCGWAAEDPRLQGHSNRWESRELGLQLVAAGFEVDAIDFRDTAFVPRHPYDLVIDIDRNLGRLAPLLPRGALRLLHMTGSYGPVANAAERSRLEALRQRRGLSLAPRRQVARLAEVSRSLEAADRCSLLGNAATLATYPDAIRARTTLLPATASFLGPSTKGPGELVPPGREFLYFAGPGAIHKGLDLVLEAFERLPGWRLHVVSPIGEEVDFLQAYSKELRRPEVTLHDTLDPAGPAFGSLVRRCFAVLQPSCSEGQSTSVLTCMQAGLLPIVSRECGIDVPPGAGLLLDACGVSQLEAALREAHGLSDAALAECVTRAQAAALQGHGRQAFSSRVAAYLAEVLAARDALLAARGCGPSAGAPLGASPPSTPAPGTTVPAPSSFPLADPRPLGTAVPLVSVLVPCFRSARFLERAVRSALAQTMADLEVVVVDNASDDATWAVAQRLAAEDSRVRIFRNETNLGPVRNWRRCAALARGQFAGLLFSDDWYQPEFLAEALPLLRGDPGVGFTYSTVRVVFEDAQLQPQGQRILYERPPPGVHDSTEYLAEVLERGMEHVPVSPGCALLRRTDLVAWLATDLADPHGADYLAHGAGPDLWVYLQACQAYPRCAHLALPRVNFAAHADNLTWKPGIKAAYGLARLEFLRSRPPPSVNLQRALATCWLTLGEDPRRAAVEPHLEPRTLAVLDPARAAAPPQAPPPASAGEPATASARTERTARADRAGGGYLVTAIVSVYQASRFLRGCLDDLLSQSLHARGELEIVVVDTGSPEEEGAIVREYQERSPHLQYLRTADRRTIYAAWNLGLRVSSGRYVTNANADDRHHPQGLERLARALDERPDVDLAYADTVWTPVENETLASTTSRLRVVWPPFSVEALRGQCMVGPQPMWRRAVHERHGLFDERFTSAGDWEYWLRISAPGNFLKVDEVLGLYLINQGGAELGNPRARAEAEEVRTRYGVRPQEVVQRARFEAWDAGALPGRPAASVLLTGRGGLEDLKLACVSVLLQTSPDWELVIVDPDRCGETTQLVAQLRAKAPATRVRLIRQDLADVATAWNVAQEAAAGRWLLPLQEGLLLEPTFLASCLTALDAEPIAAVACTLLDDASDPTAMGAPLVHPSLFRQGWRFPPGADGPAAIRALWERSALVGLRSVQVRHPLTLRNPAGRPRPRPAAPLTPVPGPAPAAPSRTRYRVTQGR